MVTFDYPTWSARFPELVTRAPSAQVIALSGDVPLIFDVSRALNDAQGLALLNLVVAHLVDLNFPGGSSPASQGLTGRVTSASEGSVSVSVDIPRTDTITQAYWLQTKYGLQFWAATGFLRTFRYVPGFPRRRPLFNGMP